MANASTPAPPVPFKDHCSIVHDNVLYVYSPEAFQVLELKDGAEWKQEPNGVSVAGAVCLKGGTDGDNERPALYVVGGQTNSSTTDYPGLQRYSLQQKSWTTIKPLDRNLEQRRYHGAAYLNASSALVVYGGSKDGNPNPSSETFLMLMYPPYNVQGYSSVAPPAVNPQIHPWDKDRAVMVGGTPTNKEVFIFHPDNSWQNLGVSLPEPLPDTSVAKTSLLILDDNSKVLVTYRMSQSPNEISRNVLRGPFDAPATPGQTVGGGSSNPTTTSRIMKRQVFLNTYPAYNSTDVPSTTRTDFALALGQKDLTAVVGGDADDSTIFFNQLSNGWIPPQVLLGEQQPLVTTTSTPSATSTPTRSASPSASSAAAGDHAGPNTLAILGGVLGGVCGVVAILIILLLWMRYVRRKKAKETQAQKESPYPEAKGSLDDQFSQPLAVQGQPMGRSPVPSAVVEDPNLVQTQHGQHDSIAMFSGKIPERAVDAGPLKSHQHSGSAFSLQKNPFARTQSPLTISKPMLADLGDYRAASPGIELGKATPVVAQAESSKSPLGNTVAVLPGGDTETKKDQRKTDEGWAAYFQADKDALQHSTQGQEKRDTVATDTSTYSAPPSRSGGGGGFWPGSGVHHSSARSTKAPLRNSEGATVTTNTVSTASPTLQAGPNNPRTLTMSTAEGIPAKISRAESISTSATDDDDYEDDRLSAYSSGVPHNAHNSWTPFGSSGPSQRPESSNIGITEFPMPTSVSNDTSTSGASKSTIPAFPMPATVRHVQPASLPKIQTSGGLAPPKLINPNDYRTSEDYFGRAPTVHQQTTVTPQPPSAQQLTLQPVQQSQQDPTDMSWINLGTPVQ